MARPLDRSLFLLTDSGELNANLRRVVERPFGLVRVHDWKTLRQSLGKGSQISVCLVDAMVRVGRDVALAEELREITHEHPLVAVVACISIADHGAKILDTLRSWGVAEILDLDRDRSAFAVARRLEQVRTVWAQRLVRRALPRILTTRGRALLEAAADVTCRGGAVDDLGKILGVSRNTVTRWCEKAGVPEPRRMFSWIRLLVAANALEDRRRSIENVARMAGFASAGSLKSSAINYIGLPPSEIRECGAFDTVARLARTEFREAREVARHSKRHENSWYN